MPRRPPSLAPAFDMGKIDDVCQDIAASPAQIAPQEATQVLDHVFIGSVADAKDAVLLKSLGITHVIAAAKEFIPGHGSQLGDSAELGDSFTASPVVAPDKCLVLPIRDRHDEDIAQHFDRCNAFLDAVRAEGGKALVHCRRGISRSPTLVLAYVMRKQQLSFEDAHAVVKGKRGCVSINLGFRAALEQYEAVAQNQRGPCDFMDQSTSGTESNGATPFAVSNSSCPNADFSPK